METQKTKDSTRKVGSKNKNHSLYITSTSLKERYETQACKPFPVKYPWDVITTCSTCDMMDKKN